MELRTGMRKQLRKQLHFYLWCTNQFEALFKEQTNIRNILLRNMRRYGIISLICICKSSCSPSHTSFCQHCCASPDVLLLSRPSTKSGFPLSLRHQVAIPAKIRPAGATITRLWRRRCGEDIWPAALPHCRNASTRGSEKGTEEEQKEQNFSSDITGRLEAVAASGPGR